MRANSCDDYYYFIQSIEQMGRVVFILLMMIIGIQNCPGRSPNGTLCPSYCRTCNNNRVCTQCCSRYFLNSTIQCQRCNDLNCEICVSHAVYGNSCTRCVYPYGLITGTPGTCSSSCSTTTAVQCSSLNSCNSSGSCISCYLMYVPLGGYCRQCDTLWQSCSRCNSTHCLSCQSGKVLNRTSYQECVSCSSIPRCNSCETGPTCTSCDAGYYPNASSCQPCRYPCLTCDSPTSCNSCNTTDRLHFMFNGSCVKCTEHPSTSNCTECTYSGSIYTCYNCIDGFYLSAGSACVNCPYPCLTCANASYCISCISNQYSLSGGACNLCNTTISNCVQCYDQTVCIECEPEFALNMTSSTSVTCVVCETFFAHCQTCTNTACLSCLEGYGLNGNLQCVELPCAWPCLACRTGLPSTCLTCIQGFFYNTSVPNTCSPCAIGCLSCDNQTYCQTCLTNYVNNNGICQLCPVTTFYSSLGKVCNPCPSRCLTCDVSDCFTCEQFFSIKAQSQHDLCVDTCGDGIVVENQCDLRPNALLDGCSNQCTIQNDFTCMYANVPYNTSNGSIMVNTSTCSYVGTISISVAEAKQSIVSNTIQLTFNVSPYLSGMPTSLDPESYLKSVFMLNSTHSLGSITASVDESQGTITFSINYQEDLSLANITFGINFDAIVSNDPALQYLSNTSSTFSVAGLQRNGCFGKFSSSQDLSLSQLVYNCTLGLSLLGLALFFIGVFTKQLAGFEQMVLFQTIFTALLFSEAEVTRPILSLLGFKYSLAISLPDTSLMASSSGYLLESNNQNLTGYYIINFLLYLLPLLGFAFLLYKLRHKNFAFKAEIGRHASEFFKGQLLLYFALFNLFPLVVYSKLFLSFQDDFFFWDLLLVLVSLLITLYALSNYILRPQIMGIFRSAFRTFGGSRQEQSQNCIVRFVSYRFCAQTFGEFYSSYAANHYYLFISYQILSVLLIVLEVPQSKIILTCMQALVLLVLIAAKPYFNLIQKCRSILMFVILILVNFIDTVMSNSFILVFVLLISCCVHALLSAIVLIHSFVVQIKRKCNDRSEVVKKLFKVPEQMKATTNQEKELIEKSALIELINRFNESHRINPISYSSQKRITGGLEAESSNIKILNEEDELKEEVILEEENQHLRYQRGLAFFDKYGKELQTDLVKEQYDEI